MRTQGYQAAERLRAGARTGAVAAVALSPWLFGSADPWAYLSVCLLAGLAGAAWLASMLVDFDVRLRAPGVTLALLALPALLLVQMLPLPASLAERLSPVAARARAAQVVEFARTGAADFLPVDLRQSTEPATVSAAPAATARSLYLLAAYIVVFLVLANCLTAWGHVQTAATALAVSGFAMALFAIVQGLSGTHQIYWFHAPRFGGLIFGPFTNRNHYAAQMNMLFGVSLGLLLASAGASGGRVAASWRERAAWFSGGKGGRLALLSFGVVLMAASVCLSLSRGGISSLAAAAGLVGAAAAVGSRTPGRGKALLAVGVLALGAVVWLGWRPVVDRFGALAEVAKDPMSDTRAVGTMDTLRLFAAAPVLGSGFGSYQHAFSIFQSASVQNERWLHAHDDYAQLLAEGGVLGALLFAVVVVAFVVHVGKRMRPAPEGVRPAPDAGRLMACGLAIAVVAAALHSFVDYGMHKPANAFLFAAVCGMTVACAHLTGRTPAAARRAEAAVAPGGNGGHAPSRGARRRVALRVGALAALALVASLTLLELGELRGELAFERFYRLSLLAPKLTDGGELEAAVRNGTGEGDLVMMLARRNPDALWTVSATCLSWASREELDPVLRLNLADAAVGAGALAVQASPSNYENWLQLARAFRGVGLMDQAQTCLERAGHLAPRAMKVEL